MANDIIDIIVTDNSDNVQLNVTPNLVSINVSQTSGNIIGSNYYLASTFSALPITGDLTTLYVINDTSLMYRWSGSAYTQINSSAVVAWGQITGTLSGQTDLQTALNAKAPLASPTFTGTVSGITKSMVGLSNVDNTSDVNKPISTATQTALNLKADINNPTFTGTVGGITKAMVGLSNVDNTSDVNKPISSATQIALDTKAPLASPTFTGTVSGITKSMVGLSNVDNTTDLLKPISTATQSALNLKYDASNPAGYTTNVGTVTSVGGTGTVSGLSLSGSVTTSGNLTLGGTLSLTSGNVTTALGYTPYDATNPSGYISGITSGQVTTALGYTPENSANKGIANGYASLDGGGLVPSTQLPSYVDDVLEFADLASFPASGTTGKIYVALDTNKIYRWSGATYIEVSPTVGTIWGGITGTLSNQTDLQNALNAKQNNLSGTGFVKSTAGTISYDTATYYPYPTGNTTQYVAGDGSLIAFPVAGQAGTLVRLVRNQTGATLTKGTVVYISGATGNNPIVEKALATGDSTSAQTFGLCQANIANNAEGYVVLTGDLTGLDTSAFTEGQQLYLSPTTAGTYTATKQYAPNHLVYIGVITRAHPTLGQIEVKIQNGYELDELHNVSAQSPANNDGIFYNTTTSLWEKKSIATVLGYTPANAARSLIINGTAYDLTADRSWSVGTVTSVAALTLGTTGTDVSSSVATGTTTPVITLNIPTASATNRGALSATDWSTFNNKQTALSGTGFVKISGTTISYDNSTYYLASNPSGYTTNVGTVTSVAAITLGTTGTDLSSSVATGTTTPVITLNVPTASATNRGVLSSADWTTFNNKASTAALSGYLPLTGGTLTGALGGTSALFTSSGVSVPLEVKSTTTNYGRIRVSSTTSTAGNYRGYEFSNGSTFRGGLVQDESTEAISIFTPIGGQSFILASTGAATFSSTVTATGNVTINNNNANPYIYFGRTGTSAQAWSLGTDGTTLSIFNQTTFFTALAIASTGAATFSSSNAKTNTGNWHQTIYDTSTMAAGVGGGISFCGNKATSTLGLFAAIDGYKENATSGNELGGFRIWTSNGTNLAERMRITSAGRVAINVTPNGIFHAKGTSGAQVIIDFEGNNENYYDANTHSFRSYGGGGYPERMRITSDGNVQINNAGALRLYTESNGAYWSLRTYNAVSNQLRFNYQGSDLASIATSTGNYTALSDVNKKKDFEQSQIGLNEVLGLKPTLYRMKTEADTEDKHLGFIAQEVKEFIPQAYSETGEGDDKFIGLSEMPIIAALTKAIQELSAKVSLLENK